MPPPDQTGPVQTGGVVEGRPIRLDTGCAIPPPPIAAERTRREQWAAALRWAADLRGKPTRAPGAVLDGLANQIEAGQLTPWAVALEPSTPPAQPAHTAPGGDVGHPGTPDCPAVLGRALRDDDGDLWYLNTAGDLWLSDLTENAQAFTRQEIEAEVGEVVEVLLVRPEVGRALEAAREMAGALRLLAATGPGPLSRPGRALVAAWDALDQPTTGGPDHDGLTGAPLEQAERDIEPDSCPVMVHRGGVHENEPCGRRRPCPYHAEPAPDPNLLETTDCPRHTTWRDCAVAGCPPPQEPAPEPAGDGPGWDRASIEGWLDFLEHGPEETRDPESADQLRALLADRDRLYAAAQAWAREGCDFEVQRDRLEEELVGVRGELDRLRGEVDEAWSAAGDMATIEGRAAAGRAEVARVRKKLATARRDVADATVRYVAAEYIPEGTATREDLQELAEDFRTGARTIPGADLGQKGETDA